MKIEYSKSQEPSVQLYANGTSSDIDGVEILEVMPETSVMIAKHPGEDGTVFADTRVIQPARYRVVLGVPDLKDTSDAWNNLMDATYSPMQKYTVTSFYSRCTNLAVTSSRRRDTPDMVGLRVQEVAFEECLEYENTAQPSEMKNSEDSQSEKQSVQVVN